MQVEHVCPYCGTDFLRKRCLDKHLAQAKYCLEKRGVKPSFECTCGKVFIAEPWLKAHKANCKISKIIEANKKYEEALKEAQMYREKAEELEEKLTENEDEKKDENSNLDLFLVFENKHQVRVLGSYEKPLFVGRDIALILGYKDTKDAIKKHVDKDDKIILSSGRPGKLPTRPGEGKGGESPPLPDIDLEEEKDTQNGRLNLHPDTILINESGLYSLILRSKLPSAKKFKKWVTSEVLPSIRRKGSYHVPKEMKEQFDLINQTLSKQQEQITFLLETNQKLKKRNNQLEELHHYVEFDIDGPVFYILVFRDGAIKIGIAGTKKENFDDRLRAHRTDEATAMVHLVVTSSKNFIENIERQVKFQFNKYLETNPHEVLVGIDVQTVKSFVIDHILEPSKGLYDFNLVSEEKMKEYNDDVKDTIK